VRDAGWVLQTGLCLMNVLSACVGGKISEVKKIKNSFQSEKVGQRGEFIYAPASLTKSKVGSQFCPLVATA